MANPRPDAAPQSPWAERANRAHTVAVETFVVFGALAAMTAATGQAETEADGYPGLLGLAYFCGLVAHYIVFTLGVPVLRTLAFVVMALASVRLALGVMGAL